MKIETKLNKIFSLVCDATEGHENFITLYCFTEGNEQNFEPCFTVRMFEQQLFINDLANTYKQSKYGKPFNLPRDKKELYNFLKTI